MKRYEQKAVVTAPAIAGAVGMLQLLEARKHSLEIMIRDRLRQAREGLSDGNVSHLNATLRKVRKDIAASKAKQRS